MPHSTRESPEQLPKGVEEEGQAPPGNIISTMGGVNRHRTSAVTSSAILILVRTSTSLE